MLTLEEERLSELRRELVALLHLTRAEYGNLDQDVLRQALDPLKEVRGILAAVDLGQAALKLSIPPMLRSSRLREVLGGCLRSLFRRQVGLSLRLPGELADTVETAREVARDWPQKGLLVLCFTDEESVGEPSRPLVDLKRFLGKRGSRPTEMVFPINHYDILCLWNGVAEGLVWGPERTIADAYAEWTETVVGATARSLEAMLELLGRW